MLGRDNSYSFRIENLANKIRQYSRRPAPEEKLLQKSGDYRRFRR